MKYYLKQSGFLILYNLFMTVIAFAILMIPGDDLLWLRLLLCGLNISLYLVIVAMTFFNEGREALKVRHANDLNRREIIRTGEDLPLKVAEEYKPWKGYFMGGLIGAPIIICLFIHTILIIISSNLVGAGGVAGLIYMSFFAPISTIANVDVLAWWHYYILLYALPILSATAGIAYRLGGDKQQRQYDMIEDKQRQIYGGKV
ncbi:MAG: hypothetical protein E7369_01795 [Clostridiales bacterium]|nr:hypothetical protein [Clostridiales bacterium]